MTKKARPFLLTRSLQPENQESPIHFLRKSETPIQYFYRRNHFPYPTLNHSNYWLQITNQVSKPQFIHLNDLLSMPSKSLYIPLECAGNKRANFTPKVYGEQWEDGAISQGKWTGVPLREILADIAIPSDSQEVVFVGADHGKRKDSDCIVSFKRSLPLEKALHPDTLIAYQYNDQPLSFKHGHPYRLIVPNWYAMASVKWLQKIDIIQTAFKGPFQTDDYMYYPNKNDDQGKMPVTRLNVNSTIQKPLDYSILDKGNQKIEGIAWTGEGSIAEVQISIDNGQTWNKANLSTSPQQEYSWVKWSLQWNFDKEGEYTIFSRAIDTSGRMQPNNAFWNRKGYGYNEIAKLHIRVQ